MKEKNILDEKDLNIYFNEFKQDILKNKDEKTWNKKYLNV